MSAATRSPLRSLRSLRGERATPLRVNSKPDTLCALKPDTSICPQQQKLQKNFSAEESLQKRDRKSVFAIAPNSSEPPK